MLEDSARPELGNARPYRAESARGRLDAPCQHAGQPTGSDGASPYPPEGVAPSYSLFANSGHRSEMSKLQRHFVPGYGRAVPTGHRSRGSASKERVPTDRGSRHGSERRNADAPTPIRFPGYSGTRTRTTTTITILGAIARNESSRLARRGRVALPAWRVQGTWYVVSKASRP